VRDEIQVKFILIFPVLVAGIIGVFGSVDPRRIADQLKL
jgi:hypothetical protein